MPFTLSHAAASLPFRRLKPIWPALVIGTFAPDLQYFVWISDEDRSGHRFPDVVLFTLPLALIALWLFEYVVKGPAIELLPARMQQRLRDKSAPLSFVGWRQFSRIVFWIAIGIATHVVWDQFTHGYSWLARHWTLLQLRVDLPFGYTRNLAHLLQDISTLLGLAVLCLWFAAWYRHTPPGQLPHEHGFSPLLKIAVVLTMAVISALTGYPVAVWRLADHPLPITPSFFVATVLEATTTIFCVQLVLYAVALKLGSNSRRVPARQTGQPGD